MARAALAPRASLPNLGERMQDVFAQARREVTIPEASKELAKAEEEYRQMRDTVVRAMGAA